MLLVLALHSEEASKRNEDRSDVRKPVVFNLIEKQPVQRNSPLAVTPPRRSVTVLRAKDQNNPQRTTAVGAPNRRISVRSAGMKHRVNVLIRNLPVTKPKILYQGVPNPPRMIASRSLGFVEVNSVEQRPAVRETTWKVEVGRTGLRKYELAFPYVIFRIIFCYGYFDSLSMYYRNSPVNGMQSKLYYPNLPHLSADVRVCLGRGVEQLRAEIHHLSKPEQIQRIIDFVWYDSIWDLQHQAANHFIPWTKLEPKLDSLDTWEKETLRKPTFILKINWEKRRGHWTTVQDVLNLFYE